MRALSILVVACLVLIDWGSVEAQHPAEIFKRARRRASQKIKQQQRELAGSSNIATDVMKDVSLTASDFFGKSLASQASNVTPEQAAYLFQNFKILENTKSYKAFLATGNTDSTKKADAQLASVKELMGIMGTAGTMAATPGGLNATMTKFLKGVQADKSMSGLLEKVWTGEDKSATHKLQQAFADQFLGGLDLNAMYDNTFVDQARKGLMADKDLQRIIGEPDIINVLSNDKLKMNRPDKVTDGELQDFLSSLL